MTDTGPAPQRGCEIEVPPGTPVPLIDRIIATLLPGLMPEVEAQMEIES
jgi:hypothetical protein